MLKPTKHTDPSRSVLAVSALLLGYVRQRRTASFKELREHLRAHKPGTDRLFVPAASLLYLLGLVEYRRKTDAFEYLEP